MVARRRMLVVLWFVVAGGIADSGGLAIAQDADQKRLTFTNAASAGGDFRLQGEYVGWVLTGSQEYRPIGLQVIALGSGQFEAVEYAGGLPGAGAAGKARVRIKGSRRGPAARFVSGPLRIHVAEDRAVFYLESIDSVIAELQKVDRISATLGARPPHGAVVLFDGTSTDHFKGGKMTDKGLLIEGTETKAAYASFRLHLEFRLPFMPNARGQGRGNSGVYLQSRYEVQILDSFGLAGKNNECGGLYRYREPAANMCLPPLSWQTYDIDLKTARFDSAGKKTGNARLTVWHNGVLIHDDFEVERKTGAGKPEGPLPLPTKLQNHSNPIRFRNIWLVDRSGKPTATTTTATSPRAPVE